ETDLIRWSQLFRRRDRLILEVPRTIETLWLSSKTADQNIVAAKNAVESTSQLVTLLNQAAQEASGNLGEMEQVATLAETSLKQLQNQLGKRIDAAVADESASDAGNLRNTLSLLAGSGVPIAARRSKLRSRIQKQIEDGGLDNKRADSDTRANSRAGETSDPATILIEGLHPSLYWLSKNPMVDDFQPTGSENLVAQGTWLRKRLADFARAADARAEDTRKAVRNRASGARSTSGLASSPRIRFPLQEFSTLETWVSTSRPVVAEATAKMARQRFLLDLKLWANDRAAEMMDEFWCQAEPDRSPPFFANAARKLLSICESAPFDVLDRDTAAWVAGVDQGERLRRLRGIAGDRQTLGVNDPPRDDSARRQMSIPVDMPPALPRGSAATWINNRGSRLASIATSAQERDSENSGADKGLATQAIVVAKHDQIQRGGSELNLFFRGLRRSALLQVPKLQPGFQTVFVVPQYPPPSVAVEQLGQRVDPVVIVLDCSDSMGDDFTPARDQVRELLNRLAAKNVPCGLVLFGSRYGWTRLSTNEKGEAILFYNTAAPWGKVNGRPKKFFLKDLEEPIHPDRDVLTVPIASTPAGRLKMKNSFTAAQAKGTTPTYHAMVEAMDLLNGTAGTILMITDGEPSVEYVNKKIKSESDFRETAIGRWKKAKGQVNLTIVNYRNADLDTLKEVFPDEGASPAKYLNANQKNLQKVLNDLFPNPEFEFVVEQSKPGTKVPLATRLDADPWPDTVELVDPPKTLTLFSDVGEALRFEGSGGEAFELEWDGQELQHTPIDRKEFVLRDLQEIGPRNRELLCDAIEPKLFGDKLQLDVLLENRKPTKFTPRPVDAWFELNAFDPNGTPVASYYVDRLNFVLRQAVPRIRTEVMGWPRDARVELKGWFNFDRGLLRPRAINLSATDWQAFEDIRGSEFQVQRQAGGKRWEVMQRWNETGGPARIHCTPQPVKGATILRGGSTPSLQTVFEFEDSVDGKLKLYATPAKEIKQAANQRGLVIQTPVGVPLTPKDGT
ncbi:MAG: hypothetical protein AAF958_09485, partial [Planctomycetota bacterium]